jgi:hypothetical protein
MPIVPRTPDEIRQSLIAYLVSTGVLTSIDEGDAAGTILGAFGAEMSALEHRLLDFVNGHLLNVSGQLLTDRAAQIPNVQPRRGQVAARGGSVSLTKTTSFEQLVFEPGDIRISNPDTPTISYTNRDIIAFDSPTLTLDDQYFVCTQTGSATNAPAGTVTQILQGNGLASCINVAPFTEGSDREPDELFRQRAMAMILSLARSQANAIEAIALNFTDSAGTGVLHAKAFEYADSHRGYTELVVSDGQGMPGATRAAATTRGTIPELQAGTRHTFWFDSPAADRISLTVEAPPNYATQIYRSPQPWWIPIEEKGVAWTQEPTTFLPTGALWSIAGHRVYQGWVAEFQDYVNRNCTAAGTRVRVVTPQIQVVNITANCIVRRGYSIPSVFTQAKDTIVEFFNRLGPGQPAFMHKLHDWVARVPGIENIIFDQRDLYPGSPRTKLVSNINSVTLR